MKTRHYLLLLHFLVGFSIPAQNGDFEQVLDSIQYLRKLSKDESLNLDTRLQHAKKASALSYKTEVDTTILKSNESLSKILWENNLFKEYKNLNKKNLVLATKINDSSALGEAYLNLGEYYRKKANNRDSAFYQYQKAEKVFKSLNNKLQIAKVLYGIATINREGKNYTQSEVISYKGISLLESIKITNNVKELKSFFFNNLGIIYNELNIYPESIKYQNKSIKLKKSLVGNYKQNIYRSINNLGHAHKRAKKYKLAINSFKEVLEDNYIKKFHPSIHIMAMENYAHTLFLTQQYKELPNLYHKALKIADTTNVVYETIVAYQHLAEYYHHFRQQDSAKYYAYKAEETSKKYYADDVLKSLLILSKVEDDSIAIKHYESYIKLNDSILKKERLARNKFARIQYETDNYIKETERLSTQNTLLTIGGLMIVFILGLFYVIKIQYSKNEKLRFVSEQQAANEEIYALMLRQQAKVEEGRLQERNDIAEELHDGILNRLTGSRLGLEFLTYEEDYDKSQYVFYMNEFQNIEKDIRDLSHSLKNTKLNLNGDFISIIKSYLKPLGKLHKITCKVKHDKTIQWEDINDIIKVNVYRIIQETTQNTIKHAKANSIIIQFSLIENQLKVEYNDNGTGFNQQKPVKGIGLKNIVSRVNKLKGKLDINSEVDKGTTLTINIPL